MACDCCRCRPSRFDQHDLVRRQAQRTPYGPLDDVPPHLRATYYQAQLNARESDREYWEHQRFLRWRDRD